MAYSKVSNKKQEKDLIYLNKDFSSFKEQLIEFAQIYYPETYNDFSEGSPGMMFLEMAAYVGDVLSFYTDTQVQETYLTLAKQKSNLYNIAYTLGYRPSVTSAASVDLDVYQLVPSKLDTSLGLYNPDWNYALIVGENSTFTSTEGASEFYTTKDIDFSFSSSFNPTSTFVYQYDDNGNPEYYLIKKNCQALSGVEKTQTFDVGSAEQFLTLNIFDSNIIKVEKIVDSDGNEWSEVPYLAQDTVFDKVKNTGTNDPELLQYDNQTPYLLKLKTVTKRFATRFRSENNLEIQFGSGNNILPDTDIIPNPDNVGLGIKDGVSKIDRAYDPSNFLFSKAYGEAPANTTLTVTYRVGGGLESNVNANTITQRGNLNIINKPNLNPSLLNYVKSTIASTNPVKAAGGGSGDTIEQIRLNTLANFGAQNRTVTRDDYLVRTLSMPPEFGRVAKAFITQDDQVSPITTSTYANPDRFPNPLAMNLHILGYNKEKKLAGLNEATKHNLTTYLDQFRSMTDAINIKDAFIINFTLDFEVTTFQNYNNQEVILNCISELQSYFDIDRWQINQPIIISEVYNTIAAAEGVQTVEDVKFTNVAGKEIGYSQYKYDFDHATRKGVIYPSIDPSIFELKYPNSDINGRVTIY